MLKMGPVENDEAHVDTRNNECLQKDGECMVNMLSSTDEAKPQQERRDKWPFTDY